MVILEFYQSDYQKDLVALGISSEAVCMWKHVYKLGFIANQNSYFSLFSPNVFMWSTPPRIYNLTSAKYSLDKLPSKLL